MGNRDRIRRPNPQRNPPGAVPQELAAQQIAATLEARRMRAEERQREREAAQLALRVVEPPKPAPPPPPPPPVSDEECHYITTLNPYDELARLQRLQSITSEVIKASEDLGTEEMGRLAGRCRLLHEEQGKCLDAIASYAEVSMCTMTRPPLNEFTFDIMQIKDAILAYKAMFPCK